MYSWRSHLGLDDLYGAEETSLVFFRAFFQLTQLPSNYRYNLTVFILSHPNPNAATHVI